MDSVTKTFRENDLLVSPKGQEVLETSGSKPRHQIGHPQISSEILRPKLRAQTIPRNSMLPIFRRVSLTSSAAFGGFKRLSSNSMNTCKLTTLLRGGCLSPQLKITTSPACHDFPDQQKHEMMPLHAVRPHISVRQPFLTARANRKTTQASSLEKKRSVLIGPQI